MPHKFTVEVEFEFKRCGDCNGYYFVEFNKRFGCDHNCPYCAKVERDKNFDMRIKLERRILGYRNYVRGLKKNG